MVNILLLAREITDDGDPIETPESKRSNEKNTTELDRLIESLKFTVRELHVF